jgi:hypothetical protein
MMMPTAMITMRNMTMTAILWPPHLTSERLAAKPPPPQALDGDDIEDWKRQYAWLVSLQRALKETKELPSWLA